MKGLKSIKLLTAAGLFLASSLLFAQTVPAGVHYQAVARDNNGYEIANKDIVVRFSILSDNPDGPIVYQEIHNNVRTSPYGVFSLVIGGGTNCGGTKALFSEIQWETSNHYVKVEVKFANEFLDMNTMQFLAVPYALYAKKSLEAGPQGPKGDQGPQGAKGDPATDDQTLSFDGSNLSLTMGGGASPSVVNLSSLNRPHSLTLLGDSLTILGGNGVSLKDYRQNLSLTGNTLAITNIANPVQIDLSKYLQSLSYNSSTNKLSIANIAGEIDLSGLKNDADPDPTNELQTLNFDKANGNLTISAKNTVSIYNTIGFKAKKSTPQIGLSITTTYPFINNEVEFNEALGFDSGNGSFIAPSTGIYTFFVTYKADGTGSSRILTMLKNGLTYEVIGPDISAGSELSKWITVKLLQGDIISLTIYTGMATNSGTGSFIGYRVN